MDGARKQGGQRAAGAGAILWGGKMQHPMAGELARAIEAGWHLTWKAVRRRLNKAADEVATEGVRWAHDLLKQGHKQPQVRVQWFADSSGQEKGHRWTNKAD